MEEYDRIIEDRLEIANPNVPINDEVPGWNRLSIDDYNEELQEEYNKVINDENIKDADEIVYNQVTDNEDTDHHSGQQYGDRIKLTHSNEEMTMT